MNNPQPCWTDSDDNRFPEDGPVLTSPVWIKTDDYKSAVEMSAKVDADGLCKLWEVWRKSDCLPLYLHGFLMVSSLRGCDAAWREINFLYDLIEAEQEVA